MKLVRVQSLVRGFLSKRKYKIQKTHNEGTTKYFKAKESAETLGGIYEKNAPIQQKQYKYKTGAIYNGQWKGGLRHGSGIMTWADGARYEGEWQYNQASGKGKFFHADGDVYDGNWNNNKANGFGVYTNQRGARYEGYWKDDQQHGHGVENWAEGARYEGEYNMSKKEG